VLQDREIRPVGGNQSIRVDVRIVAATNKDLRREVSEGRFREDLYFRLAVIPVHLPPLRERPDDVPALAEAFLRKHDETGSHRLAPEAIERLLAHPLRGNARELENLIERALALADEDEIGADALPIGAAGGESPASLPLEATLRASAKRRMSLAEVEELYIDEVLRSTGGNKVRAASILGIDRKTLYRRAERKAGEDAAVAND
jgi:DNA-binding NtrC family response regulator